MFNVDHVASARAVLSQMRVVVAQPHGGVMSAALFHARVHNNFLKLSVVHILGLRCPDVEVACLCAFPPMGLRVVAT